MNRSDISRVLTISPRARRVLLLVLSVLLLAAFPGFLRAANPVEIITRTTTPRGVNIALRANGARLEPAGTAAAAEERFNLNLNDGYSTEWRPKENKFPVDIVFSFSGGGTAVVDRVVVDMLTKESARNTPLCPKDVEIAVSLISPTAGFTNVATVEMLRAATRQMITFDASPARYLRVRFNSTFGGALQVAELEAYEAAGRPSVRADRQLNLAAAGNGGAVVRFNEPSSDAAWLIDGTARGWHTDTPARPAEVVFAFRGDREAFINRVVIDPRSNHPTNTMARAGKIFISNQTPLEGFEEAGGFEIGADGQEASVQILRNARFVKLVITNNYGGNSTSLGEVRILEGTKEGYRSILSQSEAAQVAVTAPVIEGDSEIEPNNSADQAGLLFLGSPLRGRIKPLGDEDFFKLEIDQPKSPQLSILLRGRPYIRTSLQLYRDGREIAHFDPTNASGESAIIKFPVTAGSYGIRVFEPPTSLLILYDASSSMGNSMTNLRVAVEAYVENLRASVLVNLIRFDSKHKVLLPEFTSDQALLKDVISKNFELGKGTAFFDAVDTGCALLDNVSGNRAMIIMTDGADSSSKTNYIGFWKLVEDRQIRLYTVGFGEEMDILADKLGTTPRRMLGHIALSTHGRSFMTGSADELKNLYEAIGDEIRQSSEYSLLTFWGEKPPGIADQASATAARRKFLGGAGAGVKFSLLGLGVLVVGLLVVGLFLLARRSKKKNQRLPNKSLH